MPDGLPAQLTELARPVSGFEAERRKIESDVNLSPAGKVAQIQAAREGAMGHVEQWESGHTAGIDKQIAGLDAALKSEAAAAGPPPSDALVSAMAERLAGFDPLEVEILHADATDAERILIEAAAERLGRVPRRRGAAGDLVWEPVLDAGRIAEARAARLVRTNPDLTAAREAAQRIRNTYVAMAQAARSLLK